MQRIDLNCDLGEEAGHDAELMPLITSANIACGAHAGNAATMRATVALTLAHGVAIGAHPGFADREHFGRREWALSPEAVSALIVTQIEALRELGPVRHVKPHGALYHLAARDLAVAEVVANAVRAVDPALMLVGLAGSALLRAGRARGLRVVGEAFADRTYRPDGTLTPRSQGNALIDDENAVVNQALRLIGEGRARATDGSDVPIVAETICLHGDGPRAVALARRLNTEMRKAGIELKAFSA